MDGEAKNKMADALHTISADHGIAFAGKRTLETDEEINALALEIISKLTWLTVLQADVVLRRSSELLRSATRIEAVNVVELFEEFQADALK